MSAGADIFDSQNWNKKTYKILSLTEISNERTASRAILEPVSIGTIKEFRCGKRCKEINSKGLCFRFTDSNCAGGHTSFQERGTAGKSKYADVVFNKHSAGGRSQYTCHRAVRA